MALETLKNYTQTPSGEYIVNMGELKKHNPELFPNGGMQMDYKLFEKEIRPYKFIYVRDDVNSLSFTIQNGPIKENGKNGCQVTDIIEVAKLIIEGLNEKYPCRENALTITKLDEALMWQQKRTEDRERRGVEGLNQE
jgi:hypothetical protein